MTSSSPHGEVSANWLKFLELTNFSLANDVAMFEAGRLQKFADKWVTITSDRYILHTVANGIKIEFDDTPRQDRVPKPYAFNKCETEIVRNEIATLLQKQVIREVEHCNGEYISNIFLRLKKDGKYRMILNLRELNDAVVYHRFKMSTLKSAINLLSKDCYMASIDWKDAHFCVPICKEHRKLLRFTFDSRLYEFQVLPNGLGSGPRIFTKITKPFFSYLRKMGYMNSPNIDDSILVGDSVED